MNVNFDKIENALKQLEVAVGSTPKNDLERDGGIQRFEYTIGLLWKVAKKALAENGVTAVAPKDVIRELANVGWISNPEEFIEFLRMCNESSHSYKEEVAKAVHAAAVNFAPKCRELVAILKEKSK